MATKRDARNLADGEPVAIAPGWTIHAGWREIWLRGGDAKFSLTVADSVRLRELLDLAENVLLKQEREGVA